MSPSIILLHPFLPLWGVSWLSCVDRLLVDAENCEVSIFVGFNIMVVVI